ncbi:hypothetical protein [Anaerotruncus colihominis]|uniref:hypothetical protein n=1 Tax=Anaerotruncus colihominis TaxID=169435 RepID=UPI001898DF98|nr:hypothetical protein [Anaerotruncus colihominis]
MANKKSMLKALFAGCMAVAMSVPAMAASVDVTGDDGQIGGAIPTGNGTDVYAGVVVDEPDARIKVTVPTLFAFVVNGSVDATAGAKAVTVANDGLLLPNVMVTDVNTSSGQKYKLETVGDASELMFENYSTWMKNGTTREGMELKITGSIKNEGTEESRSGWTHIASDPQSVATKDIKKYRIGLAVDANDTDSDGTISDTEYTWFEDLGNGTHGVKDAKAITLSAPDINNNLDQDTQLAINPNSTPVYFNVKVGGTRSDYKTVESSAKVGTITWTVTTPEITAPQEGVGP